MTNGAHPDGRRTQGRRGGGKELGPSSAAETSFTEVIDRRTGSIRASGRLDPRAADMLSGTVEALHQGGCTRVFLDLGGLQADDAGVDAIRVLEAKVAARGGHVALLNWPG